MTAVELSQTLLQVLLFFSFLWVRFFRSAGDVTLSLTHMSPSHTHTPLSLTHTQKSHTHTHTGAEDAESTEENGYVLFWCVCVCLCVCVCASRHYGNPVRESMCVRGERCRKRELVRERACVCVCFCELN